MVPADSLWKTRLPALFKFVYSPKESIFSPIFVCFTYFWGDRNVFFDAITAILIAETRLNSARWRIAHKESVCTVYFDVMAEIGQIWAIFRKKWEKSPEKGHFDPLWRHSYQIFMKNAIFVIYESRQKFWGTASHVLGVHNFGPPRTDCDVMMTSLWRSSTRLPTWWHPPIRCGGPLGSIIYRCTNPPGGVSRPKISS